MEDIGIGNSFDADFLAAITGDKKEEETSQKDNVVELDDNDPLSFLGLSKEEDTSDKVEETKEDVSAEKTEDKTEVKKEEKATEEKVVEANTDDEGEVDYENVARILVESGEWEEFEFEGENGKITKEDFEQLRAEQQKARLEKLRETSFDKDEKEFLEFKKNGGDIKAYADSLTVIKNVDEKLDITTDRGKKVAIATYYKNFVGWKDEKINNYIAMVEKSLTLDEEAEMAEKEIKTKLQERHEALVEEAKERAAKIEEKDKEYKETLKEVAKNKKYETKQVNQILRDIVEKDETGLSAVDKKYVELRNNPELITDLWEYLFNKEKLIEKIKKEATTKNNRETFKKIVIGKRNKDTKATSQETNQKREVVVPI
jgi:hypothetical protein